MQQITQEQHANLDAWMSVCILLADPFQRETDHGNALPVHDPIFPKHLNWLLAEPESQEPEETEPEPEYNPDNYLDAVYDRFRYGFAH